jgi:hypothetical protein
MQAVPDMDNGDGSDTIVMAKLLDSSGRDLHHHVSWPVMDDAADPVWNKVRVFHTPYRPDYKIALTIVDQDLLGTDPIGVAELSVRDLMNEDDHSVLIKLSRKAKARDKKARKRKSVVSGKTLVPPVKAVLRLRKPASFRKTVFFIRHGESTWNDAQASHNVVNMIKEYDHGLSEVGKLQATCLAECTLPTLDGSPPDPDVAKLMSAGVIYSSPLTRAIQTGMIGLEHHPTMRTKGVVLIRDVREVKNPGSFDTVGVAKGSDIRHRVAKKMQGLFGKFKVEEEQFPSSGQLDLVKVA